MSFYASYPPISSGGGGGSGTVTSVGLLDGSTSPIYTISGSPVTTSGTLTFTLGTKAANLIFAGPTTGAAAQPSFRSIVAADLPTGNLTDVGTDGITITGGTNVVIGTGTSIAQHVADSTHNGYLSSTDWTTFNNKGSGSVTSVAMTVPSLLSVSGSPITGSGTFAVTYSGTALPILNGGTGQTTASAAFNALSPMTTAGDLIYGGASGAGTRLAVGSTGNILTVSGGNPVWAAPATSGTVTSVAMSVPAFLSVAGSPITSSGTLAVSYSGTALPIANGGTNSTTILNNNRFMVSSAGAIVEAAAVTASRVVVSDANGLPSASSTTTTQVQYLNAATGTTGTTSTNLVFSTSPSLVTPNVGVATATSINKVTITTPATGSTLTIADGKTLTANNSITLAGTDATVMTFPSSSDTVMGLGAAQTVTANKTFAQTTLKLQDNTTNTVTLSTTNTTTSYTIKLPAAQGGASTTLQNDGAGNLTWVSAGGGSGTVTSVAMSVPAFLSVSGSPITTSGTLAVSYSGTALPIANGGTGVTAVPTSKTASAFTAWDVNSNLSANNFIPTYANNSTDITLTVSSSQYQILTSTANVTMPVTSTLVQGMKYFIENTSEHNVTVKSSGGNTIGTLVYNSIGILTCTATSGTGAGSWKFEYIPTVDSLTLGLYSSSFSPGFNATTTAGGTTTLSLTAMQIQQFTGSSNQTVKLSDPSSTLTTIYYNILNNSTGTLTIQTSAAGAITTMAPNTFGYFVWDGNNSIWKFFITPMSANSAGQYIGTATNDAATAGNIGEEIIVSRAFASTTAPTSATSLNITASALALTAGDWEVNGYCGVTFASAPAITTSTFACSTTSATLPGTGAQGVPSSNQLQVTGLSDQAVISTDWSIQLPPYRVSISASTNFYPVANITFTGGTSVGVYGFLRARRMR